jgi:hypothetical protein
MKNLFKNDKEYIEKCFYKPSLDNTNKIDLMRYANNVLSYGYNKKESKFYLCTSPILSSVIFDIITFSDSFNGIKKEFFKYKENNL